MRSVVSLAAILFCSLAAAAQTQPAPTPAPVPAIAPEPAPHPPFPHGETTRLRGQIAALLADPAVSRAHWGIAVTALDGTPIYGMDEDKFFRPASNAKLYTTAAAMALLNNRGLGTAITSAPPDAAGVVHGDLTLRGVGDPGLSARRFPYESPAQRKAREQAEGAVPNTPTCCPQAALQPLIDMAAKVAAKVKQIDGDIVVEDDDWAWEPYGIGWGIDDEPWGYGAPVSAMAINDNQRELRVIPGAKPGDPAETAIAPIVVPFGWSGTILTVGTDQPANIDVEQTSDPHQILVRGTVQIGHPDVEEIAVRDPAQFAADALKMLMAADGVALKGSVRVKHRFPTDTRSFHAQVSEPVDFQSPHSWAFDCPQHETPGVYACHPFPSLADDVSVTLKVSQNLHAEMLLKRMGKTYGDDGTFAQGARVVRQWLLNAGLDGDDFVFYDGSGLSSHDLVTPRTTAQLLAYATKQPWFAQWKAALPVGGEDGSLTTRFPAPPLKDHVFAKTGTLGESRALSGYLDTASGKQVIFSIYVDDHQPGSSADRKVMDEIVAAIAAAE